MGIIYAYSLISLLLSLVIGNGLNAMEDEQKQEDITVGINLISTGQLDSQITTLDELRTFMQKMDNLWQTQNREGENFKEFFERSSGDIAIDPQVFVNYADEEGLTKEFEPGCFGRIFFCRNKRKDRFFMINDKAYQKWGRSNTCAE